MTLPKERQQYKHRPATVVYQRMTPQLMLAYRIFSPGLADEEGLDKLNKQMHRIINDVYVDQEVVVENGKKMRKGVGILEDIKRQMNVTEKEINEAYDAYKAEIERMIEEDRAYLAAKARGEVDEGNNEKAGKKRKSSRSSSSSASAKRVQRKSPSSPIDAPCAKSKSPSNLGTDGAESDNGDEQDNAEDDEAIDEEEEEFENKLYEVPADRWMTKAQALAKLSDGLRRVEAMHSTLDIIHDFYKTQMVPRHEITEVFQSAFSYMTRLRAHVQEIFEVVEGHDGGVRERGEVHIWEDDRTAVTVLVPQLIPKADEIPLRVAAMEGLMEEVSAITDELAKAAVEPTRKRFRAKLAELVKQAHTPVPPPYWGKRGRIRGEGTRAPGAKSRHRNMNSTEKSQGSSLGEGRNKRAKATEVITINDD